MKNTFENAVEIVVESTVEKVPLKMPFAFVPHAIITIVLRYDKPECTQTYTPYILFSLDNKTGQTYPTVTPIISKRWSVKGDLDTPMNVSTSEQKTVPVLPASIPSNSPFNL